MNKLVIGVVGGAMMLATGAAVARPLHLARQSQIWEQARVPLANGMEGIAVVKRGNTERTVACRDTAEVLATFRPEVVAFQPVRGSHGKKATAEEVAGVETFTPVAFRNCTVAAGDHFQQDVAQAQANPS
ncbi:hypothetical protein [Sphingomonas sp. SORGH_AS_0879]|uniref:hypothetical protein n=1 Tax=Sphingomonas sp. SORGH_AS_0879 TaxID=3041790 RepID=UPI00277EB399|nr:hypothetical protein [Sphingomonas sp. SORGH_AS_0879]MDQ1229719.1 hypothetical protein [Sphingomonas sp. SORGH_AS_0879]